MGQLTHPDKWAILRQYTQARIGLGRAGTSLPTQALLNFQLAHAQAIDAVHAPFERQLLENLLKTHSRLHTLCPPLTVCSQAADRVTYLQRPDLGRQLDEASEYALQEASEDRAFDIVFVLVDGLSPRAVTSHAVSVIDKLVMHLGSSYSLAPLCIATQGRVALGDDVANAINARMVVVLIGERPGLSSPDSLGIYLTWCPGSHTDDSLRNCISNVRPEGLGYEEAAKRCFYLIENAIAKELTGVQLKDRSDDSLLGSRDKLPCFLLPAQDQ